MAIHAYVHLFHGKDAVDYRERYRAGLEPDESPYGFHHAESMGIRVSYSRDRPRSRSRFGLAALLRRLCRFDIAHAFHNRQAIARSDIVWVMTEGEAFATALLFLLRLAPRRPIIANSVWIMNNWHRIPRWRKAQYRLLSRYFSILTVHAEPCLPLAREAFPDVRSELMFFGVNTEMFHAGAVPDDPLPGRPLTIFAAGNDRTRDWQTLIAAFGGDPRFALLIACPWLGADDVARHGNIELIDRPSIAEFLAAYARADVVAVPMVANSFSGITVALEAAALGRPLLSSRTGGVPTYFDEDAALYADVGDAEGMRDVVLRSTPRTRARIATRAMATFVERDYSTRAMIARYVAITHDLEKAGAITARSDPTTYRGAGTPAP